MNETFWETFTKHLSRSYRTTRFSPRHVPLSFDGINPRMDRKTAANSVFFFFFKAFEWTLGS